MFAVIKATNPHRRTTISFTARLALVPLSVLNLVAGTVLVGVSIFTAAVPTWVSLPAAAVTLQAIYTLAWVTRKLPFGQRTGHGLFVMGEVAALLAGGIGLVAAIAAQTTSGHAEYGPLTLLVIVTVHAGVGLLAAFTQSMDDGTAPLVS